MTPLAPSPYHRPGDDPDLASDIEFADRALAKRTPAALPELTQAMWDERLTWSTDQWADHLVKAINAQPPQAQATLAHWMTKGRFDPIAPEVIAKALGLTMVKVGDVPPLVPGTPPDPTAPVITPQPVDGGNILNGARTASPGNAARVAAIMAAHRHKPSGRFQSPSKGRGASEIQKTGGLGLFRFTTNQRGAR